MISIEKTNKLNNFNSKYLVIGINKLPFKSLPVRYEFVEWVAEDIEQVYDYILGLENFKVFTIGDRVRNNDELISKAIAFKKEQEKKENFEKFLKLKDKLEIE